MRTRGCALRRGCGGEGAFVRLSPPAPRVARRLCAKRLARTGGPAPLSLAPWKHNPPHLKRENKAPGDERDETATACPSLSPLSLASEPGMLWPTVPVRLLLCRWVVSPRGARAPARGRGSGGGEPAGRAAAPPPVDVSGLGEDGTNGLLGRDSGSGQAAGPSFSRTMIGRGSQGERGPCGGMTCYFSSPLSFSGEGQGSRGARRRWW